MDPRFTDGALLEADPRLARARPKILLADDEPVVLLVATKILHRSNFEVTPVRSAEEALGKMQAGSFDLIVTDFRMNGKSGADVALAARDTCPKTPVVLVTGRIDDVPDWLRWGAFALPIVLKPFSLVELLDAVNGAMANRLSVPPIVEKATTPGFGPTAR